MKSMNPRERVLALAVGGLLVLVLGFFVQSWISGKFAMRQGQLADLRSKLQRTQRDALAGERAKRQIADFQARSLPADHVAARNLYHHWLLGQAQRYLQEPTVSGGNATPQKDLYVQFTYNVRGKATLPQVVDLLHAFYATNWLHRVKRLNIKPVEDSKLLDITMNVEALSMNGATGGHEPGMSDRLQLASREAYHEAIVNRNLFGPPNRAPTIRISGSRDATVNRPAELTIAGTDPDPHDKLRYRLAESAASEARLDPDTGRFRWTPRETGRYEFVFEAVDDGYPNMTSRQERVTINVTPSRPLASPPPPPAFDYARYTVLSGVLKSEELGEVWLFVRPTEQMLKLHEGDQFQVGSVRGTVAEIGRSDFTFESDGKLRKLAKGNFLHESQVIGDAAPASGPAEDEADVPAKLEPSKAAEPMPTIPVAQEDEAG